MFAVKDGKVAQVAVKSGMKIGELVEVIGKVAVGDKVVVRPSEKLRDGSAVAIASK